MRKALLTITAVGLLVQAHAFARNQDTTTYRLTGTRIAFGQDVRIERDEEVTDAAQRLIASIATSAPPRNREEEARKAQERARERFA